MLCFWSPAVPPARLGLWREALGASWHPAGMAVLSPGFAPRQQAAAPPTLPLRKMVPGTRAASLTLCRGEGGLWSSAPALPRTQWETGVAPKQYHSPLKVLAADLMERRGRAGTLGKCSSRPGTDVQLRRAVVCAVWEVTASGQEAEMGLEQQQQQHFVLHSRVKPASGNLHSSSRHRSTSCLATRCSALATEQPRFWEAQPCSGKSRAWQSRPSTPGRGPVCSPPQDQGSLACPSSLWQGGPRQPLPSTGSGQPLPRQATGSLRPLLTVPRRAIVGALPERLGGLGHFLCVQREG